LDLAHRHPARVHGDDLVVKPREETFVLGNEQRLEAAFTVARHVDAQRAILGQNRLASAAIAMVVHLGGLVATGCVTQVMAEFPAQRPLDQRLLEGHRDVMDRVGGHRPLNELVKQFLGNLRQRGRLRRYGCVLRSRLAWHTCSDAMPRTQNSGQARMEITTQDPRPDYGRQMEKGVM
jgi:hypothetical protein